MRSEAGFFRSGINVWKVAHADRAAVLIDGAAYFSAVRKALLHARRSVFILGWDVHSRMRLVGESGEPDDGYPAELAPFLSQLVTERPELNIYLLLWDFAILYAGEREWLPTLRLDWATPPGIHFRLDRAVPTGASQHQKLVVIDDSVAFSGGLDLTIRRWDTPDHLARNRLRIDPSGYRYPPFHDVQSVVDAEAARALAEIARARWRLATKEHPPAPHGGSDSWPQSIEPQFRDVRVGIARTCPAYGTQGECREIERQFLDSIDFAERAIYIENQFLTHRPFADRLAAALRSNPALEVVIMAPHGAESWIEAHTMRYGRIRFMRALEDAAVRDRVRILCPSIGSGRKCVYPMIHSKVLIVDDKLLRIGSANLNNRSMGTDAECDLTIEADRPDVAARIVAVRNELIAEHCRTTPAAFAGELRKRGSLIDAVEHFALANGCLQPIDDGEPAEVEYGRYLEAIADPERPIGYDSLVSTFGLRRRRRVQLTLVALGLSLFVVTALTLLWYLTPLSELADPRVIDAELSALRTSVWAPVIVIAAFLIASVVAFPINVLTIGTAAAFGPLLGGLYAGLGCMTSALAGFAVGRWLGASALRDVLGKRLNRVRERVVEQGILAIAAIRLVPVAPFTIVNLAAGAAEIRVHDFIFGTMLGLAPGIIIMSVLGDRAVDLFTRPTMENVLLFIAGVAAWIGAAAGAQYLVSKYWKRAV